MRKVFFAFLLASIALGASAAQFSNFYVIPVAAHVTGANGTSWRTDLSIQNIQNSPVTVEIAVVESGEGLLDNVFPVAIAPDGASAITIPAGASRTLRDVLQNHRGRSETSGALLVGGDKAFAITSRTYDVTANGGTFGHTVAAAADIASSSGDDNSTLFIPGLTQNADFRTNLGLLMAAGAEPMTVTVTINGADGAAIGTRTFNVASGVTTHVQFGAPTVASQPFEGGAVVRITGGTGTVVAYAAVVDNRTADASFISGGTAGAGSVSPLRALLAHPTLR